MVFEVVFSMAVISWIESVGGEQVGGGGVGGGGRWGAVGGLKQAFKLKGQHFAISK